MKFGVICGKLKIFTDFYSSRHATTYAGGLAYFLFSGFGGFLGLVLFVLKRFGSDEEILKSVMNFFYLSGAEADAAFGEAVQKSGTVLPVVFGLYSGGHFYFHLIRAGENIYGVTRKQNLVNRIFSFLYLFLVQAIFILALFLDAFGTKIAEFLGFKEFVKELLNLSVGLVLNILIAFMLQVFASPSGQKNVDCVRWGAALTVAYWAIVRLVFYLYKSFFSGGGAFTFSSVCAFLLYVYFMMRGLLFGIAYNAFRAGGVKTVRL